MADPLPPRTPRTGVPHQLQARRQQTRTWIELARTRQPAPVLTSGDVIQLIDDTLALEDLPKAEVIYQTICAVLATAIRNRKRTTIRGFGTFVCRRAKATGHLWISFVPDGDWWGGWMPVLAYDEHLQPIGIWGGHHPQDLLPFGHADNPYASAAEVPLAPDWSFRAATPLPGEPPRQPWAHPERPRRGGAIDVNHQILREMDPAKRRALRRARYHRSKGRSPRHWIPADQRPFDP